jgi:CSLREA domain-containing protein
VRRHAIPALASAVALAAFAAPARAADVFVNSTADDGEGTCTTAPRGCTLREAVNHGLRDTIHVPAGTYVLGASGSLRPDGDNIVGAGARVTTISGNGVDRVFFIATVNNEISGVTITNGGGQSQESPAGGAILLLGAAAQPSLTLINVTVSGNHAQAGGGIASNGLLSVLGSTISGNVATTGAGSIGGGIVVAAGTTTLRNTTVSGNRATDVDGTSSEGGGILVAQGILDTQNVTIAGNSANSGGGIFVVQGSVTLASTLLAGNTPGSCGGASPGGDHSLSSDACGTFAVANPLLGPLANNGGPTNTHALLAGSPAIDGGANCPSTDQRGVARHGPCDIGAYEFVPPGTQPPPTELPPPVAHKSVNLLPARGTVKIKLPGKKHFRLLDEDEQVPLGTVVDTRKGRVRLVAASNSHGGTATALFYDGIFKLGQTKGARPITTLALVEKLSCKGSAKKATAAKKKKRKRRLWGDGKGKFRTKGSFSSATVRGTKWLVEDRCTSTLTRVKRGKVAVRDFVRHKTVLVKAGHRYIAHKRRA